MSLAMTRLISKVPEYVASARGQSKAAGGATKENKGGVKASKRKAKEGAEALAPPPKKKAGGKGGGKPEGGWPDEEGALGPNGLKRLKGGNPESKQECRRHSAGGCPYKFCSYKH